LSGATRCSSLRTAWATRNVHDEESGLEGIQELCARHVGESPPNLLGHLFSASQRFTANCKQWNDMTAAYFHFAGGYRGCRHSSELGNLAPLFN